MFLGKDTLILFRLAIRAHVRLPTQEAVNNARALVFVTDCKRWWLKA